MSHKSDEGLGLQWTERIPTAIGAAIGFTAVVVEAWHIFHFLLGATGEEGSPIHLLSAYLWTSFSAILILGLISAWYYHRLGVRVGEVRSREAAIRIQHLVAEEVRRCAAAPPDYKWKDFDEASHKVKEFLALRLPEAQYAITIKMVVGSRLRTVFRDPDQDLSKRCSGDDIDLHDSHVYMSFRSQPRGEKRWVYVRDSNNVPSKPYSDRARACGFRSVVAFPLREPVVLRSGTKDGIDVAGLRGFWSLDTDEPDAFVDLFRADKLRQHHDNDGAGLKPRADIQAFYGIADCMATILMLLDSAAVAPTEGDKNASS